MMMCNDDWFLRRIEREREKSDSQQAGSCSVLVFFQHPPRAADANMKVLEANAGLLSNFEVKDLLLKRGADKGPLGGSITVGECKVALSAISVVFPAISSHQ
ncbi:unnamed protein product [Calypogeia fissa]